MSEQTYEPERSPRKEPTWRQSASKGQLASHIINALRRSAPAIREAMPKSAYEMATLPARATIAGVRGVGNEIYELALKSRTARESGDMAAMNAVALDTALASTGAGIGLSRIAGPVGGTVLGAGVGAKAKALRAAKKDFDPLKLQTNYPDVGPPSLEIDKKSGKEFLSKSLSPEAEAVAKARRAAQKDIDAGNYTPYFNLEERTYVDPKNYPLKGNTLTDAMPKKQETINKFTERFNTPDARKRLTEAYLRKANDPLAKDWYAMGQLENEYIKELGKKEGRAAYKKDFADSMAATTGGADPTSNLMMAHYGNYLRTAGKKLPAESYNMPFPIGGRYVGNNMRMYDKVINNNEDFVAGDNPKRFNFSANFQGYKDRATMDEQMSSGIEPGMQIPPGDSYGITEKIVHDLAKKQNVQPMNFQDVAWAGLKNVDGKPMMQHINEALERTSRITGLTPEQVLRKNYIRKLGPMFSVAATTGAVASNQEDRN